MSLYQFYFIYILFPTKSFNALSEATMETTQFTLKNIVLEEKEGRVLYIYWTTLKLTLT